MDKVEFEVFLNATLHTRFCDGEHHLRRTRLTKDHCVRTKVTKDKHEYVFTVGFIHPEQPTRFLSMQVSRKVAERRCGASKEDPYPMELSDRFLSFAEREMHLSTIIAHHEARHKHPSVGTKRRLWL